VNIPNHSSRLRKALLVHGTEDIQKKLTITVNEDGYSRLHRVIGRGNISGCIEGSARPHVVRNGLASGYKAMAEEERRERESPEWSEATCGDGVQKSR
jgi:hypothetical protein